MTKQAPESQKLFTTVAVIEALGGIHRVAEICKTDVPNVCNWPTQENFPARYFLPMWLELVSLGYWASPKLWRQELPRGKEALLLILAKKASAEAA